MGAFSFHFKSVTIAQGYQRLRSCLKGDLSRLVGGRGDYRNNLSMYREDTEEESGKREIAHLQHVDSVLLPQVLYPPINSTSSQNCVASQRRAEQRSLSPSSLRHTSGKMRIAFAISDPARTPRAGDIMTATELGSALEAAFDVSVAFLHRGPAWYDPARLADLDVVIAMLDA